MTGARGCWAGSAHPTWRPCPSRRPRWWTACSPTAPPRRCFSLARDNRWVIIGAEAAMNEQVAAAIAWNGTGAPPPPPFPPNEVVVRGIPFFGMRVYREADAENDRRRRQYDLDTTLYQIVLASKRRPT